jgi:hypothetical protein
VFTELASADLADTEIIIDEGGVDPKNYLGKRAPIDPTSDITKQLPFVPRPNRYYEDMPWWRSKLVGGLGTLGTVGGTSAPAGPTNWKPLVVIGVIAAVAFFSGGDKQGVSKPRRKT